MVELRWNAVCLDCGPSQFTQMVDFYSRLLGWPVTEIRGGGWAAIRDPHLGVGILIQAEAWYVPPVWPEDGPTEQTKMMHFEIQVEDVELATDHAVASGARVAEHQPKNDPEHSRVFLDPAGHPFCLWKPHEPHPEAPFGAVAGRA